MNNESRRKKALFILLSVATAGFLGVAVASAISADSPAVSARYLASGRGTAPAPPAETTSAHADDATYEGGRAACRRCHLREYRSWERTVHATALEGLPEENRGDPDCVKCHVTGYGTDSGFKSIDETPELAGVGCEACHGPGSLYNEKEIMKDREASVAAGLTLPDEQTCLGCHNSESPKFPGTFDYESAKEAGVHEIKR